MELFCAAIRSNSRFFFQHPLSQSYQSFLMCDFACLSLEISIQLFSLHFSGYFSSIDAYVVCIISIRCNQSFSVFFNVVLESLYRCIDVIFTVGGSSSPFFSCDIESVFVISGMYSLILYFIFSLSQHQTSTTQVFF